MENHEKSRKSLCLICLDRAKNNGCRILNKRSNLVELVQEFFMFRYDPDDVRVPCAICSNCRQKLQKLKNKDFSVVLPEFPDYQQMASFRPIRGKNKCDCFLCQRYQKCTRFGAREKIIKLKVRKSVFFRIFRVLKKYFLLLEWSPSSHSKRKLAATVFHHLQPMLRQS